MRLIDRVNSVDVLVTDYVLVVGFNDDNTRSYRLFMFTIGLVHTTLWHLPSYVAITWMVPGV